MTEAILNSGAARRPPSPALRLLRKHYTLILGVLILLVVVTAALGATPSAAPSGARASRS
jgi:peptide/nickel transport system permease protein